VATGASTTTILLGTGVLLLPFHHPVVLAKRLATIPPLGVPRDREARNHLRTLSAPGGNVSMNWGQIFGESRRPSLTPT
jgi:hypothetical protein